MFNSSFIADKTQSSSSQFLIDSYEQFLSEIREDVNEGETSEFLSEDFQEEFQKLVARQELDQFSAKNFYWLNLIDSLVDTLFLLEEGDYSAESIIEYFEASEFLGFIITELEMEQSPEEVINTIKEIQEFQIISFFHLQLSNKKWNPSGPVAYRPVPELGEGSFGIYLGKNNDFYPLPENIEASVLPVIKYNPLDQFIHIDLEGEILEIRSVEIHKNQFNQSPVLLMNAELYNHSQKQILIDKFVKANQIISELCPSLYTRLLQFTDYVVPLETEELVSYSMKVLPKHSMINLFNRDLVDLVDDLLHENGHHYLNGLLEGEEELIFEDDEKIFFSPWRRSLRPIRGIYHGVLTFYWAYRLFKELSLSDQLSEYFSSEEKDKIYFRLLEEEFLLNACQEELDKAFQMNKITDYGKSFYESIYEELNEDRSLCEKIESNLDKASLDKLNSLKQDVLSKKDLQA
ncbi:MAG: hypothetical protein CME60_13360 [Halobacteriovoraceae bacterium]|nr:hypothetical protein [Halobacteriovoraceae bacterium]